MEPTGEDPVVFCVKVYCLQETEMNVDHPFNISSVHGHDLKLCFRPDSGQICVEDGQQGALLLLSVSEAVERCQLAAQSFIVTVEENSFIFQFKTSSDMRSFQQHLRRRVNREGDRKGNEDLGLRRLLRPEINCQQVHSLSQRQNLLQDHSRTATFHQAILLNEADFHNKVVLDVGGSGILSFFAVQAGAARVYSLQSGLLLKHTQSLIQAQGLSDRILDQGLSGRTVDQGLSDRIQDQGLSGRIQDQGLSGGIQDQGLSDRIQDQGLSDRIQDQGLSGRIQDQGLSDRIQDQGISGRIQDQGLSARIQDQGISGRIQDQGLSARIQDQGLSGRILDQGLSARIVALDGDLCPEEVDILLFEPTGHLLLSEPLSQSQLLKGRSCLKPEGLMFPSWADLHFAPFSDEQLYFEHYARAAFWQQRNFYGINLSSLHNPAVEEFFRQPIVESFDAQILMSHSVKHRISFEASEDDLQRVHIPFQVSLLQSGLIHGLAFWFDMAFKGSKATVWWSTAPTEPLTRWSQVRCLLHTPLFAKMGQTLTGTVLLISKNRQSYDIHITATIDQSGFSSGNILELKNPFFRMRSWFHS